MVQVRLARGLLQQLELLLVLPAEVVVPRKGRGIADRGGKLYRARSRLYRNEILQVNMRLKALAEIYTMHSFALLKDQIFSEKLLEYSKTC